MKASKQKATVVKLENENAVPKQQVKDLHEINLAVTDNYRSVALPDLRQDKNRFLIKCGRQ